MTSLSSILLDNKYFSPCDFTSGWAAGIAATCVGHPMDTVRIIQQVTNTSATKAARTIYHKHKFTGYFRGMMFPLLSTGIMSSVFFGVNGHVMRLIQDYRSNRTKNDDINIRFCCDSVNMNNKYWHFDVFFAACVAGFSYTLINIPIEVVKTMLQASMSSTNNKANKRPMITTNPMKLMIKLFKTNGIRSLYRGGTLLMLRDVPSMGVYMLTYEHLCSTLKKSLHTGNLVEIKKDPMPKYIQIISGGVAGIVSWIVVLPFDVIKSKIIADSLTEPLYKGAYDCVKKTYKTSGTAGFFRGFWLVCIRAFPVNSISIFVYETLLDKCIIK